MDIIQPFMLEQGLFRGSFIAADKTIALATGCHTYPDYVNALIAQMIVTGLFLSSSIKYQGTFALQLKGDGPVQSVVVEITHEQQVRAYARFDETRKPKSAALADTLGNGQLGVCRFHVGPRTVSRCCGAQWGEFSANGFKLSEPIGTNSNTFDHSGTRWALSRHFCATNARQTR